MNGGRILLGVIVALEILRILITFRLYRYTGQRI